MTSVDTSAENLAGAYLVFAKAFDFPRPEFWNQVEDRPFDEVFGWAPAASDRSLPLPAVVPARSQEQREDEFLGLFELGGIPLYEGLQRGEEGRDGLLEELLRFYEYFDLRLREQEREYPDHLVTELEFLTYLASKEAAAEEAGYSPLPFRRAQRDFLARHLCVWIPRLAGRLRASAADSTYAALANDLENLVAEQRTRLDLDLEGEEV